jgi:hypothetical protein
MAIDLTVPWSEICSLDITEAVAWLSTATPGWNVPGYPDTPSRAFQIPQVMRPLIAAVVAHFPGSRTADEMLSRMKAGQCHWMHVDNQNVAWITRVHIPLATNPKAFMHFEGFDEVHFEAGKAYTFDARLRHAFGNRGDTERVHLLFDVFR